MPPSIYDDNIVALVDILGWSELVNQVSTIEEIEKVIHAAVTLNVSAEASAERRTMFDEHGLGRAANTRFAYFSDTAVLSCPAEASESGWMCSEVQMLCRRLLRLGVLTRGAIVRGKLFHKPGMLFGPALVEAHLIERDVAKYPRIVVTPDAAPFVLTAADPNHAPYPGEPQSKSDADGLLFMEIFGNRSDGKRLRSDQDEAREALARIRAQLAATSKLAYRAKLGWMVAYLESVLAADAAA